MDVKLLISDFDGTLVDTFEANYSAYCEAFAQAGIELTRERYRECFGLRFDRFMDVVGIVDPDIRSSIKHAKGECYPHYFDRLVINRPLLGFIRAFHCAGGLTAIASTARGRNLHNALRYISAEDDFDLILAGESVGKGKPDPEIYHTVLQKMNVRAVDALVFEDSEVGFSAAEAAGIRYVKISKPFFENGN